MSGKQTLVVVEQGVLSSDPSTPTSGYAKIYPKADGKWYVMDASGTITEITNTSSGGGATLGQILAYSQFKMR